MDGGSIGFDGKASYVLGIRIVNTLGATATQRDYDEIGSYSGTPSTGVTLKPNDVSGGKSPFAGSPVPVTVTGNTLSFSQQGKVLTFTRR